MTPWPVIVFPWDSLGNGGTAAGADLLAEVLQEAIDDTDAETSPIRPRAYTERLDFHEVRFETAADLRRWRTTGQALARETAEASFRIWLSGNHLGVLPLLGSLPAQVTVWQLDAHLDCYHLATTTAELSPGNFLRWLKPQRRPRIHHLGHRDLFLPPEDWQPYLDQVTPLDHFASAEAEVFQTLAEEVRQGRPIWLDLDVDVLDPAFAPAVHDVAPCGLTPQQLLRILRLIPPAQWLGLSVSEFDPGRDHRDQTLNLLGWLLERALLHRASA